MSYDKNGNITNLLRNGGQDQPVNQPVAIDNLTYQYIANTNQLLTVSDSSNSTEGFKDVVSTQDYNYDNFGNQNKDDNKGITNIKYNHLNLPTEIIFTTTPTIKKINYIYDASGDKLQKVVTEGPQVITTDYLDGFQYRNAVLQFFPHAEGYVINTQTVAPSGVKIDNYNYVYNYLDHLGNVRLSYTWDVATNALKIIEENGYYPYGLKHSGYNGSLERHRAVANDTKVELRGVPSGGSGATVEASLNQVRFNHREWQSELGLNITDMDFRQYDNAIGRFVCTDPITHYNQSPYHFGNGNPIYWADPSGLDGIRGDGNGGTIYTNAYGVSSSPNYNGYSNMGSDWNVGDNSIFGPINGSSGGIVNGAFYNINANNPNLSVFGKIWKNGYSYTDYGSGNGDTGLDALVIVKGGWIKGIDLIDYAIGGLSEIKNLAEKSWKVASNASKWKAAYQLSQTIGIRASTIRHGISPVLKTAGKYLTGAAVAVTAYKIVSTQQVNASDVLTLGMIVIGSKGYGAYIATAYFVADIITLATTGQNIGAHLDDAVGQPLIDFSDDGN